MCDRVWICIIFNKILRLRQCPQYTLNNALLNFIEHMKKWGGQLDIRPPNLKVGGTCPPPSPQDWRPCTGHISVWPFIGHIFDIFSYSSVDFTRGWPAQLGNNSPSAFPKQNACGGSSALRIRNLKIYDAIAIARNFYSQERANVVRYSALFWNLTLFFSFLFKIQKYQSGLKKWIEYVTK